ncbi:hypothetical protein AGOR_G00163550 [Albula goreensis]|uniref:Semaphorin-7A-like n=1 Tax=Albula goreensis TaxID=1534307 RepID=A0A8T3CW68_9TELE|nr:hypothetical protein AGOR_G00163550 [Albula goreensis]
MYLSFWIAFLIIDTFSSFADGSLDGPRVTLRDKDVPVQRTLYVGGHGKIWALNFEKVNQLEEVNFFERVKTEPKSAATGSCVYDITTLHRVNNTCLLACGTNGNTPQCCYMGLNMKCMENFPGTGIAPFNMTERGPSLSIEGDVYSAVNNMNHNSKAIRRIGKKTSIWPDIETKVEHQICTADIGGPKAILQGKWTSRLNARLACGKRDQGQLFDQLLDVVVLKGQNWRDSRVYGLFKNSWGMTAVCVYTMGDIDHVFQTSPFKGFSGSVPQPRPGKCVSDSTKLPNDVLKHMMDYPDMENWVLPIDASGPLMVSHSHYRRIQVDSVMGSGSHKKFNVLLLSLENGGLHKVVELDGKSFIIAEMQLFSSGTHIQKMLLQPLTKRLYVSSGREVVEVDLRACLMYGPRCEDCVLAQDPYCSWNGTHCSAVSASRKGIQDVDHGNWEVCRPAGNMEKHSGNMEMHSGSKVEDVPLSSKHFLRCDTFSAHAQYSWLHNGKHTECAPVEGSCLLVIDGMTPDQDGNYQCLASEGGYNKTLAMYTLRIRSKAPALSHSLSALAFLLPLILVLIL